MNGFPSGNTFVGCTESQTRTFLLGGSRPEPAGCRARLLATSLPFYSFTDSEPILSCAKIVFMACVVVLFTRQDSNALIVGL
jgi:hypothetical protein